MSRKQAVDSVDTQEEPKELHPSLQALLMKIEVLQGEVGEHLLVAPGLVDKVNEHIDAALKVGEYARNKQHTRNAKREKKTMAKVVIPEK